MISSTAQSISSAASAASKEQRWKTIVENFDNRGRALLKNKGFDPNNVHKVDRHDRTPMLYFSETGNLQMVRYLLARGADCRKANWYGDFPLFVAAALGHLEIIKLPSSSGCF